MSTSGRIFCILYGFVGIPLFNVVAVSVGSLITGLVTFISSFTLIYLIITLISMMDDESSTIVFSVTVFLKPLKLSFVI